LHGRYVFQLVSQVLSSVADSYQLMLSVFMLLFSFLGSQYLEDCQVNLHQIFEEDGKCTAVVLVSELVWGWKRGSKSSLSLHKMQDRGRKRDLLIEKRKMSDF